jgi:hypothetical protein
LETEIVSQCGNLSILIMVVWIRDISILIMVVWIRDISCKATKCVNQNNLSASRQKKIYDGIVDTLVRLGHICLLFPCDPPTPRRFLMQSASCKIQFQIRSIRLVPISCRVRFSCTSMILFLRCKHVVILRSGV